MATLTLRPSGDILTGCTVSPSGSHYEAVDESSQDGYSTYVAGFGAGTYTDTFNFENHSSETGTITDVTMYAYVLRNYSEDTYYLIANGTEYGPYGGSGGSFDVQSVSLGSGFTWSSIDSFTGGIKCSVNVDRIVLTQLYIVVTYNPVSAPTVTTSSVSSANVGGNYGNVHGNITATGGENCSERGVCYNTTGSPTTSSSKIRQTAGGYSTGAFYCVLTGLNTNTKYYCKAYAINSAGTSYGSEVNFTTLTEVYNNLFIFGG